MIALASKDPSIINEPLLARHARHMHSIARRAFRLAYMRGFNQEQASDILKPAHERRAIEVGRINSAELMREIALEDMRRNIHMTLVNRAAVLLILAALVAFAGTYFAYSAAWNNREQVTAAYVAVRGLSPQKTQEDTPLGRARAKIESMKNWAQEKYGSGDQAHEKPNPLDALKQWQQQQPQQSMSGRVVSPFAFSAQAGKASPGAQPEKAEGIQVDPDKMRESMNAVRKKAEEIAKKKAEIFQRIAGAKPQEPVKKSAPIDLSPGAPLPTPQERARQQAEFDKAEKARQEQQQQRRW